MKTKIFFLISLIFLISITASLILFGKNLLPVAKADLDPLQLKMMFDKGSANGALATSNDLLDDSTYDNDGSCSGNACPTIATGVVGGQSLYFDAADYVKISDSASLDNSNDCTISFWMKRDGSGTNTQGLVVRKKAYYVNLENNKIRVHLYHDSDIFDTYSVTTITDSNWHHIAVVWNAAWSSSERVKIYIDGALDKKGTIGGDVDTNSEPLYIGSYYNNAGEYYKGWIDEVKIYSGAATDAEIATIKTAAQNCTPNCSNKTCGSDGCSGSCGTCTSGQTCNASGQCVATCTPSCANKACGPDGCSGSCGTCASGLTCNASGQCVANCTPNCSNKTCGSDGCSGSCGTCASGLTCNASNQCVASCTPNCSGKICGPDGCNGSCGTCSSGLSCDSSGQCITSCSPQTCSSLDYDCGSPSNGCGGTLNCGTCASGRTCTNGRCVASCVPSTCSSLGYNCGSGPDGCGATINCGYCSANQTCVSGRCTANCSNECSFSGLRECKDNGYAICNDYDKDGCLEFSNVTSCASGQKCSYGVCIAEAKPVTEPAIELVPETDTTPPVISNAAPSGKTTSPEITLSVSTNEAAACNYDIADTDFDSMENSLDPDSSGKNHSKTITFSSAGAHNYFIRCKDLAGNKNDESARITIDYQQPVPIQPAGPVLANLGPTGTVYQKNVALAVITDKEADCRYSNVDSDYEAMTGNFNTDDGLNQQAAVTLNDYGSYNYFVRCKYRNGDGNAESKLVSFQYDNPDANPSATEISPVCSQTLAGDTNGVCRNAADCVCDPDCPLAPDSGADADCQNLTTKKEASSSISFTLIGAIAFIIIVFIVIILLSLRRKTNIPEENAGQ